jgi:stage V sporulation protein AC
MTQMAEKPDMKEILSEQDTTKRNEKYNAYVKEVTPTHNCFLNMAKAFFVGGLICTLGQWLNNFFQGLGMEEDTAKLYGILCLVLLSVILTGLQIYQKIAKFAGAGTVVPITGFANSVAAPAIEFQKEGQVFGIGCKIFTICGPVILYGIFSSWVLGLIYWLF